MYATSIGDEVFDELFDEPFDEPFDELPSGDLRRGEAEVATSG